MLFAIGCNKDENFKVSPQTLAQTVWEAEVVYYNESDLATGSSQCIVEFLSETAGKYNEQGLPTTRPFTYEVEGKIMVIDSGNYTTLSGTWHIIEQSKTRILLRRYSPNTQTIVTLTKLL